MTTKFTWSLRVSRISTMQAHLLPGQMPQPIIFVGIARISVATDDHSIERKSEGKLGIDLVGSQINDVILLTTMPEQGCLQYTIKTHDGRASVSESCSLALTDTLPWNHNSKTWVPFVQMNFVGTSISVHTCRRYMITLPLARRMSL